MKDVESRLHEIFLEIPVADAIVDADLVLPLNPDGLVILDLNRNAMESLACEKRLLVVAGATHFLDEPGALKEVTESATDWFLKHIRA